MSSGAPLPKALKSSDHPWLRDPDVIAFLKRPYTVSLAYDIPYLGGYNRAGTRYYFDRHLPHDPRGRIWIEIDGHPYDATEALLTHERVEKALMTVRRMPYLRAHTDYATPAEHAVVKADGRDPGKYEAALRPSIKADELEKLQRLPPDYDISPIMQSHDAKLLARMRQAMKAA